MNERTRRLAASGWRAIALAAALTAISALAGAADAPAPASRVPQPSIERGQGEKCVADTDYMRRNHMKLLLHQRDETVHAGVRPRDTSLEGCISCHASRKTGSVIGSDGNFCQSCHSYAAVKIDCFECHASRPATAADQVKLTGAAP